MFLTLVFDIQVLLICYILPTRVYSSILHKLYFGLKNRVKDLSATPCLVIFVRQSSDLGVNVTL
mgnify:CR=1 FL=1